MNIQRPSGFTGVELLVVLAIVGVFVGLLLPAVLKARETARRTACSHRLRAIGMAMAQYEHVHFCFPPGSMNPRLRTLGDSNWIGRVSVHAHLLGYLEHAASSEISNSSLARGIPSFSSATLPLITAFLCPSEIQPSPQRDLDGTLRQGVNYRYNLGTTGCTNVAWDADGGLREPHTSRCRRDLNGLFNDFGVIKPRDVIDGLAQTVAFSEHLSGSLAHPDSAGVEPLYLGDYHALKDVRPDPNATTRTIRQQCELQAPGRGDPLLTMTRTGGFAVQSSWYFASYEGTMYNHVWTPNVRWYDCGNGASPLAGNELVLVAARSFHSNGVNVLMGDGVVRFVADKIASEVWQAIGTRNGSEPSSFDL